MYVFGLIAGSVNARFSSILWERACVLLYSIFDKIKLITERLIIVESLVLPNPMTSRSVQYWHNVAHLRFTWRDSWSNHHQNVPHSVWDRPPSCVKFHPNHVQHFQRRCLPNRQTNKQTNRTLNIRHCHDGDNYLSLCELARLAADTLLIYCWLLVVEVVLVVAVLSMPVARWRLWRLSTVSTVSDSSSNFFS